MRAACNDQMHWIGHPSTLVPIQDYGTAPVTDDVSTVINTSMSGARRVRVPRNRPPRSWSLSIPAAKTNDLSHFRTLLTATMPPYVFISADAQVTNAMTPEQSTLTTLLHPPQGLAFGGMWKIIGEDPQRGGALARLNPNAAFGNPAPVRIGPVPVPPRWTERSVTVSALLATAYKGTDGTSGAGAHLQWLDANGSAVGAIETSSTPVTGMDGLRLSHTTAKPPAGAVSCAIFINYAEVIAQPAVTWTDHLIPEWSVGNGAQYVVIDKSGHEAIASSGQACSGIRRADYSIGLIEAGP